MKLYEFAEAFRSYAAAQPSMVGRSLRNAQSETELDATAIIFDARGEPLAGPPNVITGRLAIIIQTNPQDFTATQHAATVEAVRVIFFGAVNTNWKTAMRTVSAAITNAVSSQIHVMGYSATPSDPTIEQDDFRTPISLAVGYRLQ